MAAKKAPKHLSAEEKAKIIALSALCKSNSQIAEEINRDHATVWRFRKDLTDAELQDLAIQKKQHMVELIERYATTALEAMTAIATQFTDRKYLASQEAQGLAVSFGIIADKISALGPLVERAQGSREESQLPRVH